MLDRWMTFVDRWTRVGSYLLGLVLGIIIGFGFGIVVGG